MIKKIEDMTLGQINGLKKGIADSVKEILADMQEITSREFDCGAIIIQVDSEVTRAINEQGAELTPPKVNYNVTVQFSKEKEYEHI